MNESCSYFLIKHCRISKYRQMQTPMGCILYLPYFLGYKTDFFSFQNNPKDLDPSYKTDLDLGDCLGRVKLVL